MKTSSTVQPRTLTPPCLTQRHIAISRSVATLGSGTLNATTGDSFKRPRNPVSDAVPRGITVRLFRLCGFYIPRALYVPTQHPTRYAVETAATKPHWTCASASYHTLALEAYARPPLGALPHALRSIALMLSHLVSATVHEGSSLGHHVHTLQLQDLLFW